MRSSRKATQDAIRCGSPVLTIPRRGRLRGGSFEPSNLKFPSTRRRGRNRRLATPPWPDDRRKLSAKPRRHPDETLGCRSILEARKDNSRRPPGTTLVEEGRRVEDCRSTPVVQPLRGSRPYIPPLPLPADKLAHASTRTTHAHATLSDSGRLKSTFDDLSLFLLNLAEGPRCHHGDIELRRCTHHDVRVC